MADPGDLVCANGSTYQGLVPVEERDIVLADPDDFIMTVYNALSTIEGHVWSVHDGLNTATHGTVNLSTLYGQFRDVEQLALYMYEEAIRKGLFERVVCRVVKSPNGKIILYFKATERFLGFLAKYKPGYVASSFVKIGMEIERISNETKNVLIIGAVIIGITDTAHFVFSDDWTLADYWANITWNLGGIVAAIAAGGIAVTAVPLVLGLFAVTATAWMITAAVIFAGVLVSWGLYKLESMFQIKAALAHAFNCHAARERDKGIGRATDIWNRGQAWRSWHNNGLIRF